MKKKLFLLLLLAITTLSYSQNNQNEYLSIKVQYGNKISGITNDVSIDIGQSGQHSLAGRVTNNDGIVIVDGRDYVSLIDLLNILSQEGWTIFETREMKILNESYYEYFLIKTSEKE